MCLVSKILALVTFGLLSSSQIGAAPAYRRNQSDSLITKYVIDPWDSERYHFEYETTYGTARHETGRLVKRPDGSKVLVTEGFYSYVGTDGKVYRVDYVADDKGYRPSRPTTFEEPNMKKESNIGQQQQTFEDEDLLNMIFDERDRHSTTTLSPAEQAKFRNVVSTTPDFSIGNRQLPPGVIASLLG